MTEEPEAAERFRRRAEEVRTIAEQVRDKLVKDSLMKIAADYERMATALNAVERSNAPVCELQIARKDQ